MQNKGFAFAVMLFAATSSQAEPHWQDIQRQFPQVNLQQFDAASATFMALHTPSAARLTRGSIVLLPDAHQHAFSPSLLNQLRLSLPDRGWDLWVLPQPDPVTATNSAQQLTLQKNQLSQRWQLLAQQARLKPPVIVIAQGEIAAVMNLLLTDSLNMPPAALVNLGAYLSATEQQSSFAQNVLNKVPVLDLLTAHDHPQALASATARAELGQQRGNALYRQRHLNDGFHQQSLQHWQVNEIIGWLHSTGF
ncbi:DUF3530 family protein [Alishewanella sp. SMS8]|uniref:DUF3530 family protein n=1 Tax=Alishewanella sp. SMS8 TaxID=2994676 RepID=UPI002740B5F1|nr:DUF3530 family protein [Alishewanella sp. SMS8]MDP5205942.1 DUF3530 family protein [Alishewanella sp. SMS9]